MLAAVVIALVVGMARVPATFERALGRRLGRRGRWLATVPAIVAEAVHGALELARQPDPAIIGAFAWWGLDAAAMWACVRAFGGTIGAP